MSNKFLRRQFLKASVGFIAGTGSAVMFGNFTTAVLAQSKGQRDWRFCHKCQTMFFDGYPNKGSCAAGGVHEAAGYNFVLPHDVAETPTAQKNWRFCHKCQAMFFDGYPNKGSCAAGGAHEAAGYNFVLPHDVAETPTAQKNWRFCHKCQAIFFDGYPNKGSCAAGGVHEAAGYNFVLPHETDYPGKVSNLLIRPNSMRDTVNMVWNEAGRGIAAEKIRQLINGREFAKGFTGYDANVNMGDSTATWNKTAQNQLSMEIRLLGNNVEFHTTTPSIVGSWGDPSFRVGFDMLVNLSLSVNNSSTPITINGVVVATIPEVTLTEKIKCTS